MITDILMCFGIWIGCAGLLMGMAALAVRIDGRASHDHEKETEP